MNYLYLDCLGGISGDMFLAGLVGLGLKPQELEQQLGYLGLKGASLKLRRLRRGEIMGLHLKTSVSCQTASSMGDFTHICARIERSRLPPAVKKKALAIYRTLALAEARLHGESLKTLEFEQLAEPDSFIDIVGAAFGLECLGIERIFFNDLPLSRIVYPATLRLLEGCPVYHTHWNFENITPTGAAILQSLARPVSQSVGSVIIKKVSYGAGTHDSPETANLLRLSLASPVSSFVMDKVVALQANIDDMNPQAFEFLQERLFQKGCVDVYLQPIQMKKFRPGVLLNCLCPPGLLQEIAHIIFEETTTIGLRIQELGRLKLNRKEVKVKTAYGPVKIKAADLGRGEVKVIPEYAECRRIAEKSGRPFLKIYEEIKREGEKRWRYLD